VLVLDPGVRTASSGGVFETFYIRGFQMPAIPGDISFNGAYGLVPDRRTAIDYAERIEVLKGPSALLAGMAPGGGVGGAINIVPKRAEDAPLTRLSLGAVSKSQLTTSADIGRRFGDNNEWGVRVNGAWRDGDSPKNGLSKELGLAAVALDYRGERLRVSLDAIKQRDHDDGNADLGVAFSSGVVPPAPDASTSLIPGGFSHHDDDIFQLRAEYDISPDTTVHASYGQRRSRFFALAGLPLGFDGNGNGLALTAYQRAGFDVDSGEAGMTTRFAIGSVKHTVAFNISALDSLQYYSGTLAAPSPTNLYAPVPLPFPAAPPAEAAKFDFTRLNSYALADTLAFANDRVLVTLGARHQQVEVSPFAVNGTRSVAYDKSAITPMLGVVLKASKQVSVYANYLEGLSQGPTAPTNVPTLTNPGQIFAPIKTKQRELGVKFDGGPLGATLSYFDIRKPNSATLNNTFGLFGEQQNRGLELSAFGEAARGLRVLGGATWIDPKVNNRTSATQGDTPTGVPKVQVSAGVEWDAPFAPGLTLTARSLYTSSQFVDAANTQRLPSWTRWDTGLRYATRAMGRPVILRATVENLFNKNYYSSVNTFAAMGAPRTFVASVSVDF
jgi:iron complex outermembrane receptor protein